MTTLERDIQIFILRALLAADGSPMTDESLRQAIRHAFDRIAFTASDVTAHISRVEMNGLITSTTDTIFGMLWGLTPKGKLAAEQLK
jgi:DNA-binding MarR family transcriptional regulator